MTRLLGPTAPAALILFFALGFGPKLRAQQDEVVAARIPSRETGQERDHLTGDWNDHRQRLVERGAHFSAAYVGEVFGNVGGGLSRGAVYDGLLELGLELDPGKMGLWRNGRFYFSSIYPHGPSLTDKHVGDLMRLSNIDAYDSLRLYEAWYEHFFLGGKLSLRAGQLGADDDFATQEHSSIFLNSAHGWPAFVSANVVNGGPAFFAPALGLRARHQFNDRWIWQAGAYDGDTFDDATGNPRRNSTGTRVHLNSAQGLFGITEIELRPGGEDGGPGAYKLGAWVHMAEFPDLREDTAGGSAVVSGLPARQHDSNFGIYAAAERLVWLAEPGSDEGLGVFLRAGLSPEERSYLWAVVNGGFTWTGMIPGRERDRIGLGFVYARVSREVRRSEREDAVFNGSPIAAFSDYEAAFELAYEMRVTPWWTIQPDLQYIAHPGGSRAISDAVVIGLRTSIIF